MKISAKSKILIVSLLVIACLVLTYYFHVVLHSSSFFSHFFYVPIALAAFWWKRRGLVVPAVLGLYMILSHRFLLHETVMTHNDYFRVFMLLVTGVIIALLSERIQKAEGELRATQTRYRMMFEHMSDGVMVYSPVDNGRDFVCLDMNEAAEKMNQISRETVIGRSARTLFSHDGESEHLEALRRVWMTGDPESQDEASYQGERIAGWKKNFFYRLPSREVVVVSRDRTEQKQVEEKILQLASIVESSNDAIISTTLDGIIENWNLGAEKVYGYRADEIIGKSILTLVPSGNEYEILRNLERIRNGETLHHYETVRINKDKQLLDVSLTVSPVMNLKGDIVGASTIARDIGRRKRAEDALEEAYEDMEIKVIERTYELEAANEELRKEIAERKRMEEALQESSEKIKLFAYSICHDLKNPAIGIHGLARLLYNRHGELDSETVRKYSEQIMKASEQVGAFVEKVNHFIISKEAPLTIEQIPVHELFDTIRDEFASQLSSRQIQWIAPDTCAEIRADRFSLLRAFRNLVDNALKYGGESLNEIRMGYGESPEHHIFSVADNGVGLKGDDKIFGFFQRNSTSQGIDGSGLGLAIVKEIAERHGGKAWLDHNANRGVTFYLSIAKDLETCRGVPPS